MKNEPLTNIPIAELEQGVVVTVEGCHSCEVVVHNLGRIYRDREKQWKEMKKMEARKALGMEGGDR